MRRLKSTANGYDLLAATSISLVATCMAGCGVAVEDRTPDVMVRTASSIYDLTARIERAGLTTSITSVEAVTPYGTFVMLPSGAPQEWVAQLPINQCINGFDVQYVVAWQSPPAANTEREPAFGVHQKWLDGAPPPVCNEGIGHLYTVTSSNDIPDDAPGDGLCRAVGEGSCTLRAAIMEANVHPGQDRIELGSATYTLSRSGSDDNALAGDLDITDEVAITSNGAVIDGSSIGDRIIDVNPTGDAVDVELRGVTIRRGQQDEGGGIRNKGRLHLFAATIQDNVAQHGGGVFNDGGFVEITGTEIENNEAILNTGNLGGGLRSDGPEAFVTLRDSSFIGNRSAQHGGAVAIVEGVLEARDSTISGNLARVHAGGMFLNPVILFARLRNVTITDNHADVDDSGGGQGGGITFGGGEGTGSVFVSNSIIAGNFHGSGTVTQDDCSASLASYGFNLIGVDDGCIGLADEDLTGTLASPLDPKLDLLSYFGGVTRSHRPLPLSPAVDAADPDLPNDARNSRCTHVDQRGTTRPQGPLIDGRQRCDIGAVER